MNDAGDGDERSMLLKNMCLNASDMMFYDPYCVRTWGLSNDAMI